MVVATWDVYPKSVLEFFRIIISVQCKVQALAGGVHGFGVKQDIVPSDAGEDRERWRWRSVAGAAVQTYMRELVTAV